MFLRFVLSAHVVVFLQVCLHWLNLLFRDLQNRWSPILGSSASSWISCRNKTCSTKGHVKAFQLDCCKNEQGPKMVRKMAPRTNLINVGSLAK
ncbi:hypothetical protein PFLUV_G00110630 [Perca fluviatilis]|uniref:Uncharacterized protein n=1 Tax=Perca fluviatilis TaxID=8168 RepID=A0A6A5E9R9_PERFL|nr:hypothetical protein PFLUV_G00110630 [Perca fluviatilis]